MSREREYEEFVKIAIHHPEIVNHLQVENQDGLFLFDTSEVRQALEQVQTWPAWIPPHAVPSLKKFLLGQFASASAHIGYADHVTPASVPQEIQKHFLMVSPHQVSADCPPQMRVEHAARWTAAKTAIEMAGAKVTGHFDPDRNPINYTFCRDRYIKINNTVYMNDIDTLEERKKIAREQASDAGMENVLRKSIDTMSNNREQTGSLAQFFKGHGYTTKIVRGGFLQGGQSIVHAPSKTLFAGIATRGTLEHQDAIESLLALRQAIQSVEGAAWSIVPLEADHFSLATSTEMMFGSRREEFSFYHLDLAMSEPLQNGEVLLYEGIFEPRDLEKIRSIVGEENIIPLTLEEASSTTANLVSNGMNIVTSTVSPRLREILEGKGYTLITAEDFGLEKLSFQAGSVHCMTNEM